MSPPRRARYVAVVSGGRGGPELGPTWIHGRRIWYVVDRSPGGGGAICETHHSMAEARFSAALLNDRDRRAVARRVGQ